MAKISTSDEYRHYSTHGEIRVNRHGKGKLATKVFNSNDNFPVANVIIMGAEKCALFDAQGSLSNAHRCLAEILEENLVLETIYISHAHPDHYFGLEVYKQTFPDARVISVPEEAIIIPKQWTAKWESQRMVMGTDLDIGKTNFASRELSFPIEAYPDDHFLLEGERIEILPRLMGDYRYNSALYVPSINTIMCSDCLFNEAHPFTCELDKAERAEWHDVCDQLEAMDCDVVIPGHFKNGLPLDNTAFDWNRKYLELTELELERCKTEAEFYYAMDRHFPDAVLQKSNEMNAKVFFADLEWGWREEEVWEEGETK
jgi:glyoxylase-like metal-dependent hydrolase (beta-lactamase superfamily II)